MTTLVPWISLAVALLALTINGASFRDRRRQDRRDLFLKMHERLVEPEIQEGRRLLFELVHTDADAGRLRVNEPNLYQLINRSLAMFDILAMYVERGYIDRDVALSEWGHSLARTFRQAEPFMRDRFAEQTWKAWPHFRSFSSSAIAWHEEHKDS